MKRLMATLLLIIFFALPVEASSWRFKLGPYLPGLFYSVGPALPGLGVPSGQYGGGRVVVIDPETAEWCSWARLPVGSGHESVSAFHSIDGVGINAWTESDAGAQCWTAWQADGWHWGLTQSFAPWPWALAGPSAASQGWMGLSEGRKGRKAGGWLAKWLGDHWGPITPIIPGVIVWDAAPWGSGILLGCSIGEGKYLEEWAGRLVLVEGQEWRFVNLPAMAGVVRLAILDAWPGRLWLCTIWGEIWWTDDLEDFTLWHREDYGKQRDASLYETSGWLVVTGAKGRAWSYESPEAAAGLIIDIPGVDFMSFTLMDGALVGVMTETGAAKSRPIVIYKTGE